MIYIIQFVNCVVLCLNIDPKWCHQSMLHRVNIFFQLPTTFLVHCLGWTCFFGPQSVLHTLANVSRTPLNVNHEFAMNEIIFKKKLFFSIHSSEKTYTI